MSSLFSRVNTPAVRRSAFPLLWDYKATVNMGYLYPAFRQEVYPNDTWTISNNVFVRSMPMVTPLMADVSIYMHYFFVPYRLLWDNWEKFITGGDDGDAFIDPDTGEFEKVLPAWIPVIGGTDSSHYHFSIGGIYDYSGLGVYVSASNAPLWNLAETHPGRAVWENLPNAWIPAAYRFIWNEYYRDENLQDELDYKLTDGINKIEDGLLRRNWGKDYFTSATLTRQKGTAPALPLSGILPVDFDGDPQYFNVTMQLANINPYPAMFVRNPSVITTLDNDYAKYGETSDGNFIASNMAGNIPAGYHGLYAKIPEATVNMAYAGTFDINDLRLAWQLQTWLEKNLRAGSRYIEQLWSHYHAAPTDARLDRPEYIGGTRQPLVITEVLQTEGTTDSSPQGNMAGHGISAASQYVGKYHVQEHGIIMGLLSIMPKPVYNSQGINRQWLRKTRYDYYFPEFANLGEQGIKNEELVFSGDKEHDVGIFGYQGAYDELRVVHSEVVGLMRHTPFDKWHLAREFTAFPTLSDSFINSADVRNDYLAVQNEPAFVVDIGFKCRAVRPMPFNPTPITIG